MSRIPPVHVPFTPGGRSRKQTNDSRETRSSFSRCLLLRFVQKNSERRAIRTGLALWDDDCTSGGDFF